MTAWETREQRRLTLFGGADPPDERKEGDADECYILGFIPVLYICRCPRWIVLYNLSGKEIAATTANSDGCPLGL